MDRQSATLNESAKLIAMNGAAFDEFGTSVAISGDLALVGAPLDEDGGSAYVFFRSGSSWTEQRRLRPGDGPGNRQFGCSVALSGDTAIVGAFNDDSGKGSAYVFVRSGSVWTEQQKLVANDGPASNYFGASVALSGDTALIGAPLDSVMFAGSFEGSAYVFVRSGGTWTQQQELFADDPAAKARLGTSVALSGDTALVGAPGRDVLSIVGSAYLFARSGTMWTQAQKLVPNDGALDDYFGQSVALSADFALVGADGDDTPPRNENGSTYVYGRSGPGWVQRQKLAATDAATFQRFGWSVAIEDDRAVVGTFPGGANNGPGAAYVFARSGASWTERHKLLAADGASGDGLGFSVALSNGTALVGASHDDTGYDIDHGSAYAFGLGAPDGTPCTVGGTCFSGFCVQNVCCNVTCTDACESCLGAHTGGSDGTCAPVTVGTDPKNLCDDEGASSCGTTGSCNASGACALYPASTPCGSPVCSGTTLKDQFCNGMGSCVPETGGDDCAPFTCSSGACDDPCGGDGECVSGCFCSSGTCTPKGGTGAPCGDNDECADGYCVDDVCCDRACDGACEACSTLAKGSGADGECEPVAAGGDPHDDCSTQAAETCGRTGACDGSGVCQLHAAGISCGTSMCDMSTAKGQICDGDGTCVTSTTGVDCAPYACASGACRNPCVTTNDCLTGYVCVAGTCRQPGSGGTPCGDGSECTSGHCVDDVCCDDACSGTCVACSAEKKGQGADGECGPIRATQDPDSECAAEDESTCGQNGQCNGAGACGRWAEGTECARGTCSGTTQTAPSTCDADGMCVAGDRTACVRGYRCDGRACATGCDDDLMCVTGYVCDTVRDACIPEPDGTAGAGGEAGAPATGGTATGGTAGTPPDTAGEGGEATTPKPRRPSSSDDGGCGCRTAPGRRPLGAPLLGLAVWLLFARRRSRRVPTEVLESSASL